LLTNQVNRIEQEASKWSDFIGDDVAGKAGTVRDAIAEWEAAEREANASRVARP
jgi:hypothetical protein